jgi:hypothetical protein
MQHYCNNNFSLPYLHPYRNSEKMKRLLSLIQLHLIASLLLFCQPKKTDPLLIQAQEYHQKAESIRGSIREQLNQLERDIDSTMVSSLEKFKLALSEWDEMWVEVPGFEHAHDHDEEGHSHDHHHHHQVPHLTSKEHLELQKHLLDEINILEKSLKTLERPQ